MALEPPGFTGRLTWEFSRSFVTIPGFVISALFPLLLLPFLPLSFCRYQFGHNQPGRAQ